jgi:predicted O-methyltransferase YrrM
MDIVHPDLEEYIHRISPTHHEILKEMETLAQILDFPIIGPLVGRSIYVLTRLQNPKRIMELGWIFGILVCACVGTGH